MIMYTTHEELESNKQVLAWKEEHKKEGDIPVSYKGIRIYVKPGYYMITPVPSQ